MVVISFEEDQNLQRLARTFPREWVFITDPSYTLYASYGVGRATWMRVLAPRTLLYYARTHLRRIRAKLMPGAVPGPKGSEGRTDRPDQADPFDPTVPVKPRTESSSDRQQLGGDFLIAADGRIAYAHRSTEPADRPSADALLKIWQDYEG